MRVLSHVLKKNNKNNKQQTTTASHPSLHFPTCRQEASHEDHPPPIPSSSIPPRTCCFCCSVFKAKRHFSTPQQPPPPQLPSTPLPHPTTTSPLLLPCPEGKIQGGNGRVEETGSKKKKSTPEMRKMSSSQQNVLHKRRVGKIGVVILLLLCLVAWWRAASTLYAGRGRPQPLVVDAEAPLFAKCADRGGLCACPQHRFVRFGSATRRMCKMHMPFKCIPQVFGLDDASQEGSFCECSMPTPSVTQQPKGLASDAPCFVCFACALHSARTHRPPPHAHTGHLVSKLLTRV